MSNLQLPEPQSRSAAVEAVDGYDWLCKQVRLEGFPPRGNFTRKRLEEEVCLRFGDETLTLPLSTGFVVYRRRGSSSPICTYATIFIKATAEQRERQISVLSDRSLIESRLERRAQYRQHTSNGSSYIRQAY